MELISQIAEALADVASILLAAAVLLWGLLQMGWDLAHQHEGVVTVIAGVVLAAMVASDREHPLSRPLAAGILGFAVASLILLWIDPPGYVVVASVPLGAYLVYRAYAPVNRAVAVDAMIFLGSLVLVGLVDAPWYVDLPLLGLSLYCFYRLCSDFFPPLPTRVVLAEMIEKPWLADVLNLIRRGSYSRARERLISLAERGDTFVQHDVAVLYDATEPRDDALAERWYRQAAQQGLAAAQCNLASLLAGDIIRGAARASAQEERLRLKEAFLWTSVAARQGHRGARRSARRIEKRLTEEEVAEAKRLVREWHPTSDAEATT